MGPVLGRAGEGFPLQNCIWAGSAEATPIAHIAQVRRLRQRAGWAGFQEGGSAVFHSALAFPLF
jgi:hypothetical protein